MKRHAALTSTALAVLTLSLAACTPPPSAPPVTLEPRPEPSRAAPEHLATGDLDGWKAATPASGPLSRVCDDDLTLPGMVTVEGRSTWVTPAGAKVHVVSSTTSATRSDVLSAATSDALACPSVEERGVSSEASVWTPGTGRAGFVVVTTGPDGERKTSVYAVSSAGDKVTEVRVDVPGNDVERAKNVASEMLDNAASKSEGGKVSTPEEPQWSGDGQGSSKGPAGDEGGDGPGTSADDDATSTPPGGGGVTGDDPQSSDDDVEGGFFEQGPGMSSELE